MISSIDTILFETAADFNAVFFIRFCMVITNIS